MDSQERRKAAVELLNGCRMRKPRKYFVGAKAVKPFRRDRKHMPGSVYSQCGKKKAYHTRKLAEIVAHDCFKERGTQLRVYACPFCGRFHLSKKMLHLEDGYFLNRKIGH